jgi:hypothetical protein
LETGVLEKPAVGRRSRYLYLLALGKVSDGEVMRPHLLLCHLHIGSEQVVQGMSAQPLVGRKEVVLGKAWCKKGR